MNIQIKLKQIIVLFFLSLLLTACGGLPEQYVKQAEQLTEHFKQTAELIARSKKQLVQYLKTEQGQFLQVYAKHENWNSFIVQAQQSLKQAQQQYQGVIIPLLDRNDEKEEVSLRVTIFKIKKLLVKSQKQAKKASQRIDFLVKAKNNSASQAAQSQQNLPHISKLIAIAKDFIKQPIVDYPAKKQDIQQRFASLEKQQDQAEQSLQIVDSELKKIPSKKINYAIFADSVKKITDILHKLNIEVPQLNKKLQELYSSYSKTLVDMKIDYFVQMGRTSWDNYYDYPTEHSQIFTSKVDQKVATYFEQAGEGKIAWANARGSLRVYVDKRMWAALKIVPNSNWSRGDDEGEFWINNVIYKYYHKYLIVKNKSQQETPWQAVKEDYYWQNDKNLGLTLLTKPYGMYEDEIIKKAAPPGIEYIAKPVLVNGKATGSNQYGQWRQDSSGMSFWQYYVAYSFMRSMLGGSSYYYNDWNNYSNRNRNSAYYGSNHNYGSYGSSTYNNSRYKNSSYSRQNPNVRTANGRKKLQTASIRNSGPKSRGRGPSGGGK